MTLTFTNDSATISTTEYSLPADTTTGVPTSQTTDGVFQFFIDFGAMVSGDQYEIKLYEKYDAAGTQRLVETWILTGAQGKPMLVVPSMVLGEGWDLTVKRLAGSDRSIAWSIRRDDVSSGGLDAAGVRAAVGLASANLDTQLLTIQTDTDAIEADTQDIQSKIGTPAGASVSADLLVIDNFVDDLEGRLTSTRAGYLDNLSAGAVALQISVDDLEGRLGTPSDFGSGATVAANLVDIEAQTDDIGVAGTGLNNIPWNASWDAQVESEATDALNAYDPPTRAELTSDTNSILSAISTVSGFIDTEITTILNRIGAFTGTGVNTILGFFQALMRKDATTPTDLGGAYDDATDSLEAIRDRGDSAWLTATGFSTLTQGDIRTAVGLASANLDTQLGAIDSVTDKLDTTLEADGPVYRFTTNALEQAPAGGGGGGTGLINFVYGGEWVLNQQNRIDFYLQDAAGLAVTGLGSGYTLTLAKNGAAFAASAGTKAEIGSGWYTYLAIAGEANTIGTIAVKVVGAGAVEQNLEYVVKQRTAGAIPFTYTLTSTVTGLPIEGAVVWVTTDLAGANTVWTGITDAFGIARDSGGGLPYLDPGTYYFNRQHSQFTFINPDVEIVSNP